jgi:hypothetical protein
MKTFGNLRKLRGRTIALTLLCLTVAILAGLPAYSQAQTSQTTALPCGWPVESTGSGLTNVAFPDTDATYWLMPIDTSRWQSMVVKGEYPKSRFFSFVTYFGTGGAADSIIDANIEPDAGSSNPFTSGPAGDAQNYTLTIDGNANGAGNHIQWANTQLTYVLYRIYVADEGQSRNAGVPLPSVELVDNQGNAHPIQACKLQNLAGQLPGLNDLVGSGASACPSTQAQQQQQVTFSANTSGGRFLPNPATKYISARGLCFQSGKIVVIRGKGAVYPNTYNGGSIFQPAIPGAIQMRYWSMCNNDQAIPFPVVACQADHDTQLDDQGFYTYVISPGEPGSRSNVPPSWLPADVTWLPWCNQAVQKALLFREMLPVPGFSLTGEYLPEGVFCDQQLFIQQGWQGCFAAAGVTPP